MESLLATLFGISQPTPLKLLWVALTVLNAALMLYLAWQNRRSLFGAYLWYMAVTSLIQGTVSGLGTVGESWLATLGATWMWTLMPTGRYGRMFSLSIGLIVACMLLAVVPQPWPEYSPAMYYIRLYSSAAFLGIVFGACLLEKQPISTVLAMPWFAAVLLAGAQRGWDRWTVALWMNLIWTGCLIGWTIYRPGAPASSESPDVPYVHPRSARYQP